MKMNKCLRRSYLINIVSKRKYFTTKVVCQVNLRISVTSEGVSRNEMQRFHDMYGMYKTFLKLIMTKGSMTFGAKV